MGETTAATDDVAAEIERGVAAERAEEGARTEARRARLRSAREEMYAAAATGRVAGWADAFGPWLLDALGASLDELDRLRGVRDAQHAALTALNAAVDARLACPATEPPGRGALRDALAAHDVAPPAATLEALAAAVARLEHARARAAEDLAGLAVLVAQLAHEGVDGASADPSRARCLRGMQRVATGLAERLCPDALDEVARRVGDAADGGRADG